MRRQFFIDYGNIIVWQFIKKDIYKIIANCDLGPTDLKEKQIFIIPLAPEDIFIEGCNHSVYYCKSYIYIVSYSIPLHSPLHPNKQALYCEVGGDELYLEALS